MPYTGWGKPTATNVKIFPLIYKMLFIPSVVCDLDAVFLR